MGIFTSKIAIGVLAGGFTLGGAGLLFSGTETLQNATNFVKEAGSKLTQFESTENSLLDKIGTLKADANSKITTANGVITDKKTEIANLKVQVTDLTTQKDALTTEVATLKTDIATLQGQLNESNKNLEATKAALAEKTKQYDIKVAELKVAKATIAGLQKTLEYAYAKAKEADGHIAQLEAELAKANKQVADHGKVVDQVKSETEGSQPLTQEEVDAVDTEIADVDTQN